MNYILNGHNFLNEIQTITQVFYPNEKFIKVDSVGADGLTAVSVLKDGDCISYLYDSGEPLSMYLLPPDDSPDGHRVKKSMFMCLVKLSGHWPDWGMLTGIRPSKIVHGLWARGYTDEEAARYMSDEFFIAPGKAALCVRVAQAERRVLGSGGYSLYIGIPFCPSRCLYCSFTSYPLSKYAGRVDDYLTALEQEISACGSSEGLDTVYIGGGTPTALNAAQLERLMRMVAKGFPTDTAREYTVEAGRPDTIDSEKLKILKEFGVSRLSINPQTLSDDTLKTIGRAHSRAEFFAAFEAARAEGHDNINVDLILGLPGEDERQVCESLTGVLALAPENLTVHTLAVKRASKLKEGLDAYRLTGAAKIEAMISEVQNRTQAAGMYPYYMYRQKNMLGNFENVGYTKAGRDCIYNVEIMAERQSILALGAGGVTKIVKAGRIERVFNVKSVDDYIGRIGEIVHKKKGVSI